jgi:hypothetical protein
MDSTALRAVQAPFKDRYKRDPKTTMITLKAKGTLDDAHIPCKVERDQAVQVVISAMDWNTTHRNIAAEMLAALGEHDAERSRGDLGVLEEQFIEIAHPVEQQAIWIGGFDLDVLLHHRRDELCP